MNQSYFPPADRGIERRAGRALPSTEFVENMEAQWDEARTPDHSAIYDERAAAFYNGQLAKLKGYGYGDLPNPFGMVNEFERAINIGDGYKPMVDTVRAAAPKNYQMGTPLNIIPLRDAWRVELDHILQEARVAHPDILDPAAFDKSIAEESAATRERTADIASRASFMGHLGGFAGGTAGTLSRTDQMMMTAITLPFGGGAATLARTLVGRLLAVAATDAALGAAQTGASEIAEAKFQEEHFGYSKTGSEIAMDMAYAAAGSALLGVGLQGIGEGGAYLLSRWRTVQPDGDPVVVGLHSAAEQAEAFYSVLPKPGRDAATIVESERQVAATGPAADFSAHSSNVAQAAESVTQGIQPVPVDPKGTFGQIEITSDGFQLTTGLEVVEFDELRPGSLLNRRAKQDVDTAIAAFKAMPDEEIIRFRIVGTLTSDGKAKRGGKTVGSHLGFDVHEGFSRYIATKRDKYVRGRLTKWQVPERIRGSSGSGQEPDTPHSFYRAVVELKPKSASGRYQGKEQKTRYTEELGVRAFSFEWGVTQAQHDEIIKIMQRIRRLQEAAGLWAKPKRPRKRARSKNLDWR
jgi:hypothetical protein